MRIFLPIAAVLSAGLLFPGCTLRSGWFATTEAELGARMGNDSSEWVAYHQGTLLPGYAELREATLKDDPSRGVGLKQANSMAGDEAPVAHGTPFRVFLFMGQSNMVGHGRAGQLDEVYREPHPRIRIWSKDNWHYLTPKKNFGPEVRFAHEMLNVFPGETIGIIKVAVSGTGMNAWKPDWEWSAASKTGDALKGSLYRDMIKAVSGAHQVSTFQLSGFIWKQGGRDGKKAVLAETYQDRFIEMVKHLREDLAVPELPIFVLTYFDEEGISLNRSLLEKVRPKAFPLYLSKARVSRYLENAYPVFHGRLPTRMDQVHFNTEGQMQLGLMTAEAVAAYYSVFENAEGENPTGRISDPPIPE